MLSWEWLPRLKFLFEGSFGKFLMKLNLFQNLALKFWAGG